MNPEQHECTNAFGDGKRRTFKDPVMIVAFEGWSDAGDAATGAVEYLELIWDAELVLEFDDEAYYDFQVSRPVVRLTGGVTREVQWPSTTISWCRPAGCDRDILLVRGIEPNLRWKSFCREFLDFAESVDASTVVTLGALLSDTPHSRPVPVIGSSYSPEAAARFGLATSKYEGATGIVGVIQDACVRHGLPAISYWASVPHYVSAPPNAKATIALLERLESVLEISIPLGTLPEQASDWEESVYQLMIDDDEILDYVRDLEARGDAEAEADLQHQLANVDGDAIAAEFDRYLRRQIRGE